MFAFIRNFNCSLFLFGYEMICRYRMWGYQKDYHIKNRFFLVFYVIRTQTLSHSKRKVTYGC